MHAFALAPKVTVLVQEIKDGRWVNPIVMSIIPDRSGTGEVRTYSLLFPEAADPFNTPALYTNAIMGEYEIPESLEKEYLGMIEKLRQRREEALAAMGGIIKPTTKQVVDINRKGSN